MHHRRWPNHPRWCRTPDHGRIGLCRRSPILITFIAAAVQSEEVQFGAGHDISELYTPHCLNARPDRMASEWNLFKSPRGLCTPSAPFRSRVIRTSSCRARITVADLSRQNRVGVFDPPSLQFQDTHVHVNTLCCAITPVFGVCPPTPIH
jgi:hypothetical protein